MKKKQLFTGVMSVMMLGILAMPVHAEEMTVTYREPNTYTISIPSSVDFKDGYKTQVGVNDVNLEPNKKITFKITDGIDNNGVMELARENDPNTKAVTTVSTTLDGTGIANSSEFATFTENKKQDLYFSTVQAKNSGAVKAGTYKGTLTFTIEAPEKN